MLQRYLGNKNSLISEILQVIGSVATPGGRVCDAFSGSLAVSFALKKAGYVVSANDINLLSWVYGRAFLSNSTLPEISLSDLFGSSAAKVRNFGSKFLNVNLINTDQWNGVASIDILSNWAGLIGFIFENYGRCDIPNKERRNDFFSHYCEEGTKSLFKSSRGTTGNRRYLSPQNAAALDRAMSRIRFWHNRGLLSIETRCILTACVLDAVEKVANIQGTYHDFPRDFYDPRALKPISASLPDPLNFSEGPRAEKVGRAQDSLEFVKDVEPHDVLYLDPPYNFRQYTSYYFLPNLIADYPDIENTEEYFSEIKYVRGQNMRSEFTSPFCSTTGFLPSLHQLISSAPCKYVVLSYFNGRNHWNTFNSGTCGKGRDELEKFFRSDLFVSDSLRVCPVSRLNYQSYGGYRALEVSEYLFLAEKSVLL